MIKTNLPKEVQDAFAALRPNHSFGVILGWFKESLEDTRVQNDDLDGKELTRNQGCAKTLAKILKSADEAD